MNIINSNEIHIFDELPIDKKYILGFDEFMVLLRFEFFHEIIFYNKMRLIEIKNVSNKLYYLSPAEIDFVYNEVQAKRIGNEALVNALKEYKNAT